MKIVLQGACGRMGLQVVRLAAATPDVELAAALEHPDHPLIGRDLGQVASIEPLGVAVEADAAAALERGDVVIDFSIPAAAAGLLDALEASPRPSVVAVTGLDDDLRARWAALAGRTAVLLASNLSLGAAALRLVAAHAARALADFDVEIIEAHHAGKADAPSGTALDIVSEIAAARGLDPAGATVHGRRPGEGPRRAGCIGVHAVRGGTVAGEHEVLLLGEHERLSLRHSAESREIFARGALTAARWITGQSPGLYRMDDVLGPALSP
ncbi:MAG: 4-hydroxy-tetrahydrodipicolinate reductase [Deltaproteobacteria bacterium]|nr:4-hydroxy-tetrahydrodipicolinate reductase [Deltaproteobacteria bacterium]